MSVPLGLLPKFAPIVARHFAAYLELLADEAAELASQAAMRVVAMVIALLSASFAIAMGCVWILDAVWDTQWRQLAIACLFAVFTIGAIIAMVVATKGKGDELPPFSRLRAEWDQDQQLIAEFVEMHGSAEAAHETSNVAEEIER